MLLDQSEERGAYEDMKWEKLPGTDRGRTRCPGEGLWILFEE